MTVGANYVNVFVSDRRPVRRILATQTSWNLLGFLMPAVSAFVCTPYLLNMLGTERFGFLSLIWVAFGVMGFMDIGLGRALTIVVAQLNGKGASNEIEANIATARSLVVILGVALSFILACAHFFGLVFSDKFGPQSEFSAAIFILILGLYPNLQAALLRGALEGFADFRSSNLVRAFYGCGIFLIPAALAAMAEGLAMIVASIIFLRLISNLVMAHFLKQHTRLKPFAFDKIVAFRLIRTGGWVTISNIVGPSIVYLDRFIVAYIISASALAYYSVAADAISRVLILPSSIAISAFPYIAANQDQSLIARRVIKQSSIGSLVLLLPISFFLFYASESLLVLWLGTDVAKNSAAIAEVLVIAFFINGMAQVPFSALQAMGRAKVAALWHAGQLVPYSLLLFYFTHQYGLVGAAYAVLVRATIDAVVMWLLLSKRFADLTRKVSEQ